MSVFLIFFFKFSIFSKIFKFHLYVKISFGPLLRGGPPAHWFTRGWPRRRANRHFWGCGWCAQGFFKISFSFFIFTWKYTVLVWKNTFFAIFDHFWVFLWKKCPWTAFGWRQCLSKKSYFSVTLQYFFCELEEVRNSKNNGKLALELSKNQTKLALYI